ncbi:MAG: NFACT family protein [Leptolyngbyaceae cyanobacterium MO_188.B28]|nr:NFACT family protein [Leptolyngbyaceae cyanobacterium MO_188.B28]
MQPVDFTTLAAACSELRAAWLPARCEQVYQRDRATLCLALRTLKQRSWLTLSWHPEAARIHIGEAPPRIPDTFTFSQQLKHQINGLALTEIAVTSPWERTLDLQFARRPGDPPKWHLYVEIMGKYSNVILTTADHQIVTVAHQVSEKQSSVRPLLTGQPYLTPPSLTGPFPNLEESQERWRERISLIPGPLKRMLLKPYSGISSSLARSLIEAAELDPDQSTESLSDRDWRRLFDGWRAWLKALADETFQPGHRQDGYTVLGWGITTPAASVQQLLTEYYTDQLNRQAFSRLKHQLSQKLRSLLTKLRVKADLFESRLHQSDQADEYRQRADLLMAYQHTWRPGMTVISLPDFATGESVDIELPQDKTAIQTAQALYKKHQKLKRARQAVEPLMAEVQAEVDYLEQVEASLLPLQAYETPEDVLAISDIRDELIQQGYLADPNQRILSQRQAKLSSFHRYRTPQGFEVLIGRNNLQNDQLTFRVATDYDLWFHTQEIPGSHALLRLEPGSEPEETDLQFVADLVAYFSRARQADQAPVVYTKPKHVYKPKGARPGMVIYKQERILWGQPQQGKVSAQMLG